MSFIILQGDALHIPLADESVQCVVTSPPYWGLRDYGTATWEGGDTECDHRAPSRFDYALSQRQDSNAGSGSIQQYRDVCAKCGAHRIDKQLGLEPVPDCLGWATGAPCGECYVCHLVAVFREVWRVLRRDGVVWCNLGDSYAGGGSIDPYRRTSSGKLMPPQGRAPVTNGLKPKDLVGIPWRVALALQADGWWLRSDIIWAKPNPMPESVTDRPTKAHEYLFLLAKSGRYFYDADAIKEPCESGPSDIRKMEESLSRIGGKHKDLDDPLSKASALTNIGRKRSVGDPSGRNRRSIWTVATAPFTGAHFATFPPALVEPCIKAGTSEKGACPKCGAPYERVTEVVERHIGGGSPGVPADVRGTFAERQGSSQSDREGLTQSTKTTIGWRPTCACGAPDGWRPDDLELIATPTGERAGDDPSMTTGRAGYNRPRGDNEGRRPMTRYEQRRYAEQLRNSPYRDAMEAEVGGAFAHYIRTDTAGARPVPPETLEKWIAARWIERVIVPKWEPPAPIPCVTLDPFSGAGTTVLVADRLGRNGVGLDLSGTYTRMGRDRVFNDAPLLALMGAIA